MLRGLQRRLTSICRGEILQWHDTSAQASCDRCSELALERESR